MGTRKNLQVRELLHDLLEDTEQRSLSQRMQSMFDVIHQEDLGWSGPSRTVRMPRSINVPSLTV